PAMLWAGRGAATGCHGPLPAVILFVDNPGALEQARELMDACGMTFDAGSLAVAVNLGHLPRQDFEL
ncbi:MAG: hypothetical protein NC336_09410, partial [Clostridium sp.]|nr:hypothetical protein [Clostridium sp.]